MSRSGAADLNGSEVLDIGLSTADLTDLTSSWIANMDTVKAAILRHNGFIWQQMVNSIRLPRASGPGWRPWH